MLSGADSQGKVVMRTSGDVRSLSRCQGKVVAQRAIKSISYVLRFLMCKEVLSKAP